MIALRQSYIASNAKVVSSVAVQAGDLILVGLYQDGALVTTSCADNAAGGSNAYTKVAEKNITDGAGCGVYLFWAKAKATETLTITGTMGGSGYPIIFAHVYSGTFGANPLHAFQTKGETARSTSHTSASVTTTAAAALLFCLWGEPSGSGTIAENGAGFTERKEDHGTGTYDRIVSSAGTYADAVTSTVSAALVSILAAFVEDTGITGSGASVQALQTCAGTGTVTLSGSGGSVQPVQSSEGTGTVTLTGTGGSTQALQFGGGTGQNIQAALTPDPKYSSELMPASHHTEMGPASHHSDLFSAVYEVTL